MASERTENLGLIVFPDITDVYQRELRQSYYENFLKIDRSVEDLMRLVRAYVDERLGEIENGAY